MEHHPVVIIRQVRLVWPLHMSWLRPVSSQSYWKNRQGWVARTETYKVPLWHWWSSLFTKSPNSAALLWQEVLGEDFIKVPRLSRIYYRGRFSIIPSIYSILCLTWAALKANFIELLQGKVVPHRPEENLEQWVSNRFERLYKRSSKPTQKVWGFL